MRSLRKCGHLKLKFYLQRMMICYLMPWQGVSVRDYKIFQTSTRKMTQILHVLLYLKVDDSDSNKRPSISKVSYKMIFVKLLLYSPDISIYDSLFDKMLFCLLAVNNCNSQI